MTINIPTTYTQNTIGDFLEVHVWIIAKKRSTGPDSQVIGEHAWWFVETAMICDPTQSS